MKALVIKPKSKSEFKFVSKLLKKPGVGSFILSAEELEEIGMSKLLRAADKTKKISRAQVVKKLSP